MTLPVAISAATTPPAVVRSGNEIRWKPIPEDSATWQREPFKNAEVPKPLPSSALKSESAGASQDVALNGIMKSNNRYYAIINNRTVKPGDHIDRWTVAEISRHRVTLRRAKEIQIFDIYQGRIDRGTR